MNRDPFVREFLGAWNAHDADGAASLMTDDCMFEPSVGQFPWGDRFLGRAAIRDWALKTFHDVPDIHWELNHQITNGSHAIFEYRVTGTPTGAKPFEVYACDILTIRDGLVASKRAYRKARP